ncbi:conserved hypothetical protein [Leishmania mexicana MHOM/GT/2001/U1103]|uniref:Pre-mRNA-splicing factor SLU7 n=1 Tax=Leishmania mexicana (strain MHOM/GT/2001/U1103) TaxID=929439 RepID=E9AMI8_LEIMU|nr:conserved hypothetical protein [Leishmania mexicana MHOM/GT/2001/U1103]CBZ24143.1 conserved hypothetical protein [Leishmania mexicana MHOM/GT/2001/U1103]
MEPNPDEPKKTSSVRQLLRQQRELQEMRKFGLAPLAVDTETHQEISPNIPEFISRAPWYYGATGPTLVHQRKHGDSATEVSDEVLDEKVDRIVVKGQASRFTAGACKNCGSRTHKTSECFQAKKKVGSVYTNRVTGSDIEMHQEAKTYSQKRDRFVGEVGIDLMRGVRQDQEDDSVDVAAPATARHRPEDVFGSRTAQHGGVEVKELPKYLHNLDQQDGLFFDPKTGSMRANPNAGDSTKAFRGDLERYRTGDYYNYVESQYRFLTGQSRSFVDFEFDDAMRRAREQQQEQQQQEQDSTRGPVTKVLTETPQDVLLRSLYGTSQPKFDLDVLPSSTTESKTAAPSSSPAPPIDALTTTATGTATAHSSVQAASLSWVTTRNGHAAVYGSYFDPIHFRWGYACCKRMGKDATDCSATHA